MHAYLYVAGSTIPAQTRPMHASVADRIGRFEYFTYTPRVFEKESRERVSMTFSMYDFEHENNPYASFWILFHLCFYFL